MNSSDENASGEPEAIQSSHSLFEAFIDGLNDFKDEALKLVDICGQPAAWGIASAIHEFTKITTASNDGEEHRTSTVMAFIASSMAFFNRIARLSGQGIDANNFYWHPARKQSNKENGTIGEEIHGGDFGVAVKTADNRFRVSFFQAKLINQDGTFNLDRPPRLIPQPENASEEDINNNISANAKNIDAAKRAHQWITLKGEPNKQTRRMVNHQIYKLAITQSILNNVLKKNGKASVSWCHFVLWSKQLPLQLSLDDLKSETTPTTTPLDSELRGDLTKKTSLTLKAGEPIASTSDGQSFNLSSFAEHLASGLGQSSPAGWIEIDENDFQKVVGALVSLSADWYFIDKTGGSPGLSLNQLDITPIASIDAAQINQELAQKYSSQTSKRKNGTPK